MYRTIDANINRLREAIRVIEDILRFEYDDTQSFHDFKKMRHSIECFLSGIEIDLWQSRQSDSDVGIKNVVDGENIRVDMYSIVKANFLRAQEAARVLEEAFKIIGKLDKSENAKYIRFNLYTLEKNTILIINASDCEGIKNK